MASPFAPVLAGMLSRISAGITPIRVAGDDLHETLGRIGSDRAACRDLLTNLIG